MEAIPTASVTDDLKKLPGVYVANVWMSPYCDDDLRVYAEGRLSDEMKPPYPSTLKFCWRKQLQQALPADMINLVRRVKVKHGLDAT